MTSSNFQAADNPRSAPEAASAPAGRGDRDRGRLANVEARIEGLETRMENLETRMGNLETRMGNLEIRMERVETRIEFLATKEDMQSVKVWCLASLLSGMGVAAAVGAGILKLSMMT